MSGWNGSRVRRWRAHWTARIALAQSKGEPLLCPFCNLPVLTTQAWDVDHRTQRIDGGALGVSNQAPAHASCNRRAGQATAVARRTERITRVRRWT